MKWEIKWRKLFQQSKNRNKCGNVREGDEELRVNVMNRQMTSGEVFAFLVPQ